MNSFQGKFYMRPDATHQRVPTLPGHAPHIKITTCKNALCLTAFQLVNDLANTKTLRVTRTAGLVSHYSNEFTSACLQQVQSGLSFTESRPVCLFVFISWASFWGCEWAHQLPPGCPRGLRRPFLPNSRTCMARCGCSVISKAVTSFQFAGPRGSHPC